MTVLPLAECARLLGIHPKTLRHWLSLAHMPLVAHPTDARIKCLTREQVQHLALLHERPLPSAFAPDEVSTVGGVEIPSGPRSPSETAGQPLADLTSPRAEVTSLIQRIAALELTVATLQTHLTQLTLVLLQDRSRSAEGGQTSRAWEDLKAPSSHALAGTTARSEGPSLTRPLLPIEQRARERKPPLIEYSAQGTYVIISAVEGELPIVPDSPGWFDWLATLMSFRFIGQQGRFTAYRDTEHGRALRTWSAHRTIHHHQYQHYLGVTDRLTLACLEQMAARLQAHHTQP